MRNDTHKHQTHDLIVKFSPNMGVAVVASLTKKCLYNVLHTMLIEQQTVTSPAVIHGLCAVRKY